MSSDSAPPPFPPGLPALGDLEKKFVRWWSFARHYIIDPRTQKRAEKVLFPEERAALVDLLDELDNREQERAKSGP